MKRLFRAALTGACFALGVLAVGFAVPSLYAGTLAQFVQPGAGNPLGGLTGNVPLRPQNMADYNTIINLVNANAAWAGTGTPLNAVAAVVTSTTAVGGKNVTLVQFLGVVTSTTGFATCNVTGASICVGIIDASGVMRWLAGG